MNSFLAALDLLTKNAGADCAEDFATGSSAAIIATAFALTGSGAAASKDDPPAYDVGFDEATALAYSVDSAILALAYSADAGPST